MRIWLDDQWDDPDAPERQPPRGAWIPVRNWAELEALINITTDKILVIDFDHDLGDFYEEDGVKKERDGYWIIKKLADEHLGRYPQEVRVHSANPVGRRNIEEFDLNVRKYLLGGV